MKQKKYLKKLPSKELCSHVSQSLDHDEFEPLMERYVLRGDAAAALAASITDAAPSLLHKKRQRQTTIQHGHKVVSQEHVQYLKEELDDAKTTANMLSLLDALEQLFVSLETLEKTRIGVALTRLLRRAEAAEVQRRAKHLLKQWKTRAKTASRRRRRRVETYGRNFGE